MEQLKAQADKLGVKYSANIGRATLQERVNEAIIKASKEPVKATNKSSNGANVEETEGQRKARKKKEAEQLVRVRVTCMDPKQKLKRGVTYQVANSLVGTVGKYVEFNVPYHVPRIILNLMEEKTFQTFVAGESKFGVTKKIPKQVKTFAIEYLDPLTPQEFEDLKIRQAMAGNIKDEE